MRTFLAITIPDNIKDYARQIKNELIVTQPDIKWVEYQNYHLTVKFLGDVNNQAVNEIRHNMRIMSDNCPQFRLSVGNVGFFPGKVRPRVVWLGMEGELEKAVFLATRVDDYLGTIGFDPERSHRFHLTLGRVRSDRNIDSMLKKTWQIKKNGLSFMVNDFCLVESRLSPSGPEYRIIEKFPLNG